jgi:single-strand DNA-binding protein
MPNLNRVFLLGRVVKDPELRYTPKQTAVAELGLAINRVTTDPEARSTKKLPSSISRSGPGKPRSLSNISRKEVPSSSKGVSNWTLGRTGSPVRNVGEHLRLLGSRQDSEAAALWADSSSSAYRIAASEESWHRRTCTWPWRYSV